MNEESAGVRALRFGTFELDVRARELRKDGRSLKLAAGPLQVLELLLEKEGELVTRKEMRERLWPNSFVEFDRCINTAINKVRKALGDSIGSPRYIETRSRLGYRFIAPVVPEDAQTRPGLAAAPPHASSTCQPVMIGLRPRRWPSMAPLPAIIDPRFDGDALRLQVRYPDGKLAELSLRLTTTREGALNIRLDFCGAGVGRRGSGRREAGPNYPHPVPRQELSLRRARP